jgi:hypothetical protein
MIRSLLVLVIALLLASCATHRLGDGDHWLQWPSNGATLFVYGKDGKLASYGSELLNLPGYYFAEGGVTFQPGERRIGFYCEPPANGPVLFDSLPSVKYNFKAGEAYELHCQNGLPVITKRGVGA